MGGAIVKRIVISGYYGFGNSGDEAVLQSILLALEREGTSAGVSIEPVVLSADPASTSRMYGVGSVHRMKPIQAGRAIREADGLISGGGSLLQDATGWTTIPYYLGIIQLAQLLGKPTFIYSHGIGPVNRPVFHRPIASVFSRCSYVSVRDEESAHLLQRMGYAKKLEVVPDPVMGLALPAVTGNQDNQPTGASSSQEGEAASVIGVAARYWNKDRSDLRGIAESLKLIARRRPDVVFRFLPFHDPADRLAAEEIIAILREDSQAHAWQLVSGIEHPQDMLAQAASCDLLIGMRLHSLIYAASQLVPMVAVSYDPKIDQFMRRLDACPACSVEAYDVKAVADQALHLLADPREWRRINKQRINALQKESRRPAQQIAALLRI